MEDNLKKIGVKTTQKLPFITCKDQRCNSDMKTNKSQCNYFL